MKLINKIKFKVLTIFIIILLSNKLHSRALIPKNKQKKPIYIENTNDYIESLNNKLKELPKINFKPLPICKLTIICQQAINNLCGIEDKTLLKILNVIFNQNNKKKSNIIEKIIDNIKEVNKHNIKKKNTKETSILEKSLNELKDDKVIHIYSNYLQDIVDTSLNFNDFDLEKGNLCKAKNENSKILAIIAAYIAKKLTLMEYVSLNELLTNKKNSKKLTNNIAYYIKDIDNYDEFYYKKKGMVLISPQPLLFNIKVIEGEYDRDNKYLDGYSKVIHNMYDQLYDKSMIFAHGFNLNLKSKSLKNCYGYITKENNIILKPYSYYKVSYVKEYNNEKIREKDIHTPAVYVHEIKIECLSSLKAIEDDNIISTIHQKIDPLTEIKKERFNNKKKQ